jgi:hypothetical protein
MKTEKEIFDELLQKIPHGAEDRFDPLRILVSICETAAKILYDVQNFNTGASGENGTHEKRND